MVKNKNSRLSSENIRKRIRLFGAILTVALVFVLVALQNNWKTVQILDIGTVKHPPNWQSSSNIAYGLLEMSENSTNSDTGYRAIVIDGAPIVNSQRKDSANGYGSVWIAVLSKDGGVAKINKTPACTKDDALIQVEDGYFRCSGNNIAVAIDFTDYAYSSSAGSIYAIGDRKYAAVGIECIHGDSKKFELISTCEKIVKSFKLQSKQF